MSCGLYIKLTRVAAKLDSIPPVGNRKQQCTLMFPVFTGLSSHPLMNIPVWFRSNNRLNAVKTYIPLEDASVTTDLEIFGRAFNIGVFEVVVIFGTVPLNRKR